MEQGERGIKWGYNMNQSVIPLHIYIYWESYELSDHGLRFSEENII
jgi:hypothetical protein